MTQEWKEPAAGDDVQMPLGTGGDAAPVEDYSPPRQRVNTSTLALVAAFAAALVVLYFLGLQNKPRIATAEDQAKALETNSKIEKWLSNKEGQKGLKQLGDGLLQRLQDYFGAKITIMELTGNPFEQQVAKVAAPVDMGSAIAPPPPPEVEDPVLKEVAKEFAGLKLQMVMLGSPSAAMINNQMATIGTKFKYLTITDIQTDRVMLGYKNKIFALTVSGPNGDPPGGFGGPKPR